MPIYEYVCDKCESRTERVVSRTERDEQFCERCASQKLRLAVSRPAAGGSSCGTDGKGKFR
jgi:putative FmdB family regulatory protein